MLPIPDSDSAIWTVQQKTSQGPQPASRLSVTPALMVIMRLLPSDWLIGFTHYNQLNKPVGTVFLIKWPKTLAVSLSCQCGASGVSGNSVWLQISSDVCRNNRLRSAQAESPLCSHHASGVIQTRVSSPESSLTVPPPVSGNKAMVIGLLPAVVQGWMATVFTQSFFSVTYEDKWRQTANVVCIFYRSWICWGN